MEQEFKDFLKRHIKLIEPLHKRLNLAFWKACVSGRSEDYEEYSDLGLKLRTIYQNRDDFKKVKKIKEKLRDPILTRQAEVLYLTYLGNQIERKLLKEIVKRGVNLEKRFNTFMGKIDGKRVSANQIREILINEKDENFRKKAWEASQQVGEFLEKDLKDLIKLRNRAAKSLGFENYYKMGLFLQEIREEELMNIFDLLFKETKKSFLKTKKKIDNVLKERFNTKTVFPWHYSDPFFQEVPPVFELNLDKYFNGKNILKIAKDFYKGIGFDTRGILRESDLYEKPRKYPHAQAVDIDRKGDVRVMMSVKNNLYWMGTTLHELGHAIYDENIDPKLPFLLREKAHIFITEGVAQFFEGLVLNLDWLKSVVKIKLKNKEEKELKDILRADELIFSMWSQVMVRFEKALYEDPEQNLNELWWEMKEKYQLQDSPARNKADYAAKIHFISAPVYYHNYLLGRIFASQLEKVLGRKFLSKKGEYFEQKETGNYLKEMIFKPGALYAWKEFLKQTMGEELNIKYFKEQFASVKNSH